MLNAKIKASYADMSNLREHILEPQQLVDYIETETNDFDQLYSHLLKEISLMIRDENVGQALIDNIDKPFELDDGHFRYMIKSTIDIIKRLDDENSISVANALLDVYTIEQFLVKLVDFRDKDKFFENFNNRLTNRELRELVEVKLAALDS